MQEVWKKLVSTQVRPLIAEVQHYINEHSARAISAGQLDSVCAENLLDLATRANNNETWALKGKH